jgi:hypothetical protein
MKTLSDAILEDVPQSRRLMQGMPLSSDHKLSVGISVPFSIRVSGCQSGFDQMLLETDKLHGNYTDHCLLPKLPVLHNATVNIGSVPKLDL